MSSGQFSHDPFLGYNNIWGASQPPTGQRAHESAPNNHMTRSYANSSTSPVDHINQRMESTSLHNSHDDAPSAQSANLRTTANAPESTSMPFSPLGNSAAMPGQFGSQSIMQYHHQQQHFHAQQQQQQQQSQQHHAHQGQHGPQPHPASQHQNPASQLSITPSSTLVAESGRGSEEITTVFIVGFPDDMTEREFANMFLFAKGFEASTLKIPMGSGSSGIPARPSDTSASGPGGPYSAVNVAGPGSMVEGGSWDEQSILSRSGPSSDNYSSLAGMSALAGGMAHNAGERAMSSQISQSGKLKQIIGFAKFRTRSEALEARDLLNGRKIDAERGCVLKTEMAKKNLHTKQRPVLVNTTAAHLEGSSSAGPLSAPPFSPHGANVPITASLQHAGGAFPNQGLPGAPIPPPGMGAPHMAGAHGPEGQVAHPAFGLRMRPDGPAKVESNAFNPYAMPQSQGNFKGPMQHVGFDPFTSSTRGGGNNHGVQNDAAMGADGVTGSQQRGLSGSSSEIGPNTQAENVRPGEGNNMRRQYEGTGAPWGTTGPIDFYDSGSKVTSQQRGGSANRGPDWSTLSSPPGLYRDAQAASKSNSSVTGLTFADRTQRDRSRSGGEYKYQPFHTSKEDFGQGESTTKSSAPGEVAAAATSPDSGSEGNAVKSSATERSSREATSGADAQHVQPQSVGRHHLADAASSSLRPHARIGPLRIDSPTMMQQMKGRPFSPSAALRSPPINDMAMMSPSLQASSFFRATSPGSPTISSPTNRSFSLDANPPGNTLFVGNLPASITSPPASTQLEDALFKIFSQKKGFRQMSFRVKSSGPMCFVEFDDVGCAGRALGSVNGDLLDGMVKGGLRLSFSKHPLFKGTSSSASSSAGHNRSNAPTPQPSTPGAHGGDSGNVFGGTITTSPNAKNNAARSQSPLP